MSRQTATATGALRGPRTVPPGRALRVGSSAAVVVAVLGAVLLVPLLVPLDEQAVDLAGKLRAPSPAHPFGTDDVGRDVLLRCVYGLRVSLLVGVVAALTRDRARHGRRRGRRSRGGQDRPAG